MRLNFFSRRSRRLASVLGVVLAVAGANAGASPAWAAGARVVQGQAFWDEDPGPVSDPFWTSGLYRVDPDGNMNRVWRDPMPNTPTVIGAHEGKANCVFRRRVIVSASDQLHPILRLCRKPPQD